MHIPDPDRSNHSAKARRLRRAQLALFAGSLIVLLLGILLRRDRESGSEATPNTSPSLAANGSGPSRTAGSSVRPSAQRAADSPRSAEQIVADKLAQFGRSRQAIVHAIGVKAKKAVPPEVERFFDAVESGRWEDIESRGAAMSKRSAQYEGSTHDPGIDEFWPAVLETYGAAEQAHLWPAQKLLDYGEEVLGSLRPGMVYVGGTDPGRFIPTLLNETGAEEPRVVLTQNALADSRYMEYVRFLYGDRFGLPNEEDSSRAFQDYIADARRRLEHDQTFPNEPKQIRPGEDVQVTDGKVTVSGQVAVMDINGRLLRAIMEKNPDTAFAMEESRPLPGSYAGATPLGPIMEIRAQDPKAPMEDAQALQSLDYWRSMAGQLLADPEATNSKDTMVSYAHMAGAQANLLAASGRPAEAEEAYRLAMQINPRTPEALRGLADLLADSGRNTEADELLANFVRDNPDLKKDLEQPSAMRIVGSR